MIQELVREAPGFFLIYFICSSLIPFGWVHCNQAERNNYSQVGSNLSPITCFLLFLHHTHKSFTILGSNTCSSTVFLIPLFLYYKQKSPLHSIHSSNFTVPQAKTSSVQYPLSKLYCTTNKILLCTVSMHLREII